MEKAQISAWQFFLLIFGYLVGTSSFFHPGGLIVAAKQDAWIVPLWAGASGVVMFLIWIKLASYYPGLTLIQICTKAAGKGLGGLIALLYIWFFVHLTVFVIRNLGDFMKLTLMHRTPMTVFHIMILLIVCYAVIKGIETISRATEILVPIFTLTLSIIFIIALTEWKWDRFQGMFRMDVWKTMKDTRSLIGYPFMEGIFFMMLFPYVRSRRNASFILAIAATALLLSVMTFFTIGVLGVTRATHDTYPLFVIVQEIHLGTFFEHLESTVALFFLIAIFIKLSVTYYCSVAGLSQLFRVNNRSWIALSLILLISGLAMEFDNIQENMKFNVRYYFDYAFLYSIIFPLLLLILTWIKQSSGKQKEGTSS